jgi:hypothetical protein
MRWAISGKQQVVKQALLLVLTMLITPLFIFIAARKGCFFVDSFYVKGHYLRRIQFEHREADDLL